MLDGPMPASTESCLPPHLGCMFAPPCFACRSQIEGLESLTSLRKISVQSNRLESMAGLEGCTALEELYLSHNGINRLEVKEGAREGTKGGRGAGYQELDWGDGFK
jgi:hypothetical protein